MGETFTSPLHDIEIPDVPVHRHILGKARERGDRVAIIDGLTGRKVTYRDLADHVEALARGLRRRGFGAGDVLGLLAPNCPEYVVAFHATSMTGGTVTPINPSYGVDEVAFQLRDSGASIVLAAPSVAEVAVKAARECGVDDLFVIDAEDQQHSWAALFATASSSGDPEPAIDPAEDVVVLPYSSGTTGMPKGVMLTHRNLVANVDQFNAMAGFVEEDEVVIAVLPFFHIYGMQCIMNSTLATGNTLVTLPRFDLDQFLTLIPRHQVTRAFVVPPIVLALAKSPQTQEADLGSLRWVMSGAAPLGADLMEEAQRFVGAPIIQGYGLTEASPVTNVTVEGGPKGSVGPLAPNIEMRIVDSITGDVLDRGAEGEVWFRGPNIMKGYLNRPEESAATVDPEGWLHTGDVGVVGPEGELTITDRLKELIKYKGFQVAPAELEALLQTHPDVLDAAVIGVKDDEAGEVPKAFVVARPGSDLTAKEVIAFSQRSLASYKQVRQVQFIDAVPKSAAGKILRRELREE
jgi:acyl-CoA synthetase (AMP-forming)/AMP-acid ligase II